MSLEIIFYNQIVRHTYLEEKIEEYKKGNLSEIEYDEILVEVLNARIYMLSRYLVNNEKSIEDPKVKNFIKYLNKESIWKTYEEMSETMSYSLIRHTFLNSLNWAYDFPQLDKLIESKKLK